MTKDEMITQLQQEVKGLTAYLGSEDYTNACDDAAKETGWSFPVSNSTAIYWQKQRSLRHLLSYLLYESAHRFKYKMINLQHRFEHYKTLIEMMDKKWEAAKDELIVELAGVSGYQFFGTKVDAGFAYEEQTGRDITFDTEQIVIHHPNENS
uniref:Uncharacterized protein n=1 Tax=viral metagenome TaxID=1070528 RepID=A0A6M3J8E4_9ZZZZ